MKQSLDIAILAFTFASSSAKISAMRQIQEEQDVAEITRTVEL